MFDSMIQQARQVTTAGLCRGELEGVVAGVARVIAALSALQTRCATEIEALDDGGVNSKTVLREAGRMWLFHAVSHPLNRLWSCSIR